jgi:cation transport ATPase
LAQPKKKKRSRKRRTRAGGGAAKAKPADGGGAAKAKAPTATGPPAKAEGGRYARQRAKDDAARAELVPLRKGERPRAVTIGAVVALLLALANVGLFFAGYKIGGSRPFVGVALFSALMLVAAWGMYRARYWAVLGMQALLGLTIVAFFLLLIAANNVGAALLSGAIILAAGTLFWFLVKAMARIQMPERR